MKKITPDVKFTSIKLKNGKWLINNKMYYECTIIEQDIFDTRFAMRELATPKKTKKNEQLQDVIMILIFAIVTSFLLYKFNQLCQ